MGEDSIARAAHGDGINSTKFTDLGMGKDGQHTPMISSSEMPL